MLTGGAIPKPSLQDSDAGGGAEIGHGNGASKGSRRSFRHGAGGESSSSPQLPSPRTAAIADACAWVEGALAFPSKHKPRAPQSVKHHYEVGGFTSNDASVCMCVYLIVMEHKSAIECDDLS